MWIRGMCRRVVQGIVHRAAMMRMWLQREYLQLTMGLVSVYEAEFEFRSLMAWGKKLFLSLSVFAIMLLKRLPDGSKQKRWLPGWVNLEDFSSSASAAFEVDVLQRGESKLRCAQLSARLSVELCSPGLWHYYTTQRCTESEHFLWPLNRKFSG